MLYTPTLYVMNNMYTIFLQDNWAEKRQRDHSQIGGSKVTDLKLQPGTFGQECSFWCPAGRSCPPRMRQQREAVALTPTKAGWAERVSSRWHEEAAGGRGDLPDTHPCCHTEGTGKLTPEAWNCPRQHQHIPSATRITPWDPVFVGFFSSIGGGLARKASSPSCPCPLGHMCCLGGSHLVFFVPGGTSWLSTCICSGYCCFLCCCFLSEIAIFSLISFCICLSLLVDRERGGNISEPLHHKIVLD